MENQLQRKYSLHGFTFDQYRIVAQLVQELAKHYLIPEQDLLRLALFVCKVFLLNQLELIFTGYVVKNFRQKLQQFLRENMRVECKDSKQVQLLLLLSGKFVKQYLVKEIPHQLQRHMRVKMGGIMSFEEFNRILESFKKKAEIKIEPHQINEYYKELIPKLEIRSNFQNITELINDIMRLVPAKADDAD